MSLQTDLDALTAAMGQIETATTAIGTRLSNNAATIADLKNQVANAGVPPETLAQFDTLATQLSADAAALTAMGADNPTGTAAS